MSRTEVFTAKAFTRLYDGIGRYGATVVTIEALIPAVAVETGLISKLDRTTKNRDDGVATDEAIRTARFLRTAVIDDVLSLVADGIIPADGVETDGRTNFRIIGTPSIGTRNVRGYAVAKGGK